MLQNAFNENTCASLIRRGCPGGAENCRGHCAVALRDGEVGRLSAEADNANARCGENENHRRAEDRKS